MAPTVTIVGAPASDALAVATKPIVAETPINTDDTIFGMPKWAVAATAGGVVALGLAYYVLSAPDDKKFSGAKSKKNKSAKIKNSESTSSSTTTTPVKSKKNEAKTDESKVVIEDVGEEETVSNSIRK